MDLDLDPGLNKLAIKVFGGVSWENINIRWYCVVLSRSVVSNSLWPPGTVAHQAPLSMGFSRQEYWSGLPWPPPGDLPNPREWTQVSPIAGGFFTIWATREVLDAIRELLLVLLPTIMVLEWYGTFSWVFRDEWLEMSVIYFDFKKTMNMATS